MFLPKIMARGRPGALPVPADGRISALTKADVLEKWEPVAGLRPAALAKGDNVITMFDAIGEDYWGTGGVTAKGVAAQLRAIGDRPVEVQINSFGGDMFEGIAIYNVLREHPQDVTVKVMGMAASAASIIAMAGDRIEVGAASFLMIHNCWIIAVGNAADLQAASEFLAPFDAAMAEVYAARSGKPVAEVAKWMAAETYMSGSVALERGFADALLPADHVSDNPDARASAQDANVVRATELMMVMAGASRSEARQRINKIKGTPGAALNPTPGAGADDWLGAAAGLISTIQNGK